MLGFELTEDFFTDEERSGFKVNSLMKRCWGAQLQVLQDFDRVCSKHGLKWYAFCGTLLGAVRHKGFIPWDDDMDVCMMRSDYTMFLRYAAKEMPGYQIDHFDRNIPEEGRYVDYMGITRINNNNLADFDPDYLKSHCMFPYTVGLDVYPLDYIPRNKQEYDINIQIFSYLINVAFRYKSLNWTNYKVVDGNFGNINLDEAYDSIFEVTGYRIDKNGDILNQLNELAVMISSYTKGKDSDEVACMAHMALNHRNMIFPKEAFAKTIEAPFESGSIPIPAGYNEILKRNYGARYMEPRNVSPHDYPYYKKQERWVRDYIIKNPDMKGFMPDYYISDIYDEDPEKKVLLDKIYGKE